MKSKKQVKAEMLVKAQDQLHDRNEVAKIIQEELINQLEGGTFWSELQEIISQGKPAVQVLAKWSDDKPKKKGKKASPAHIGESVKAEAPSVPASKVEEKEAKAEAKEPAKRKVNKVKTRGQLVKRIMAERGVSLIEASKIIKEEGLL